MFDCPEAEVELWLIMTDMHRRSPHRTHEAAARGFFLYIE